MPSNNHRAALALAAVLLLAPVTAQATIANAIEFDTKVDNAASIVLGRVVSQEARWDAARNWILTYSTFQVEKTMKGFPAQQITIVTPGGTVGTVAQDVVGVPRFREGEDHLLFVRNSQAGPTVLYFEQGAYRVVKEGSDRIVQPLVSSAVLVDTQRGTAVAPERPRSLREFEGKVRDTIQRREAVRMKIVEQKKREQASIWNQIQRNKLLVAFAMIGVALAAWQVWKHRG
ncbi:MAG TPA: hypothetical protein VEK57_31520 [Thermoanaerobaculia bacterium]|nr:hypothetical protein [Thermoanaerobaculia bacterium]